MKRNELTQIKLLDLKELRDKTKMIRQELANLLLDKNMKKLKDLKSISKKRKDIAQVLTVIKQKELLWELESKVKSLDSSIKAEEPKKEKEKSPRL